MENEIEWLAELGEGSFGTVYKCRINDELVAVKKFSLDEKKIEAAEKEIAIHQKIKSVGEHPNIATMIEFRKSPNGHLLLIMKLYDTTLYKHTRERLPKARFFLPTTCLSIFKQIVNGLHHLHCHSIAHRDLKVFFHFTSSRNLA